MPKKVQIRRSLKPRQSSLNTLLRAAYYSRERQRADRTIARPSNIHASVVSAIPSRFRRLRWIMPTVKIAVPRRARLVGSGISFGVTVSECKSTAAPLVVLLSATKNRKLLVGLINTTPPELVASPSFAPRVVPAASLAKMPSNPPALTESAPTVNELKPEMRLVMSSLTASLPLASISGLSSMWP
jgi:hypothetical protein